MREQRLGQTVELNRYLYQQCMQIQTMLVEAADLQAVLEVLLVNLPRHFGFRVAELWLYDPEHVLAGLITSGHRYGPYLQLYHDMFEMQELYEMEPGVELIDATDSRMFEVLKTDQGIQHALLLPLLDSGRLLGSYHFGFAEPAFIMLGSEEKTLLTHLAAVISATFKQAVSRQQVSRLTMVDPLTQISNLRGFEKDIAREIARARRADDALSVLMLEIDEFEELHEHYGEVAGRFVLKKVTERVSSGLRATDYLARLSDSRLAVLLTGTDEVTAGEVAERIRADIEGFMVDDGQGGALQVTVSIGLVTWEPRQYPALDMAQLARQMQAVGSRAVEAAIAGNGNRVKLSRLATLIT
ncbi:GGDEF domain-containing protein [Kineobactrum salinum]|uniref:diguanylate cyclase n=1 Tax=Kineobactrum salinum TaxID=2708301 RepID=A0A6C0UA66_9GAMM|nr:GGDEF domain-containing protein [Kineobactrum salinum]QIB66654.1 GGDEF domain-containing protein [Kineobactrum salinum]